MLLFSTVVLLSMEVECISPLLVFLCEGQKHGEHFKRVHRLSSPICLWSWMARVCQLWQVLEFSQASLH